MPFPRRQEIEEPLLREIAKRGGTVKPRDVIEPLANHFALTSQERADKLPSGMNRWSNLVFWVRNDLREDGDIDGSVRGHWQITVLQE